MSYLSKLKINLREKQGSKGSEVTFDPFDPNLPAQEYSTEQKRAGYLNSQRINSLVENGIVPDDFVEPAYCNHCGWVLLDYRVSAALMGCPWCICPVNLFPAFQH